MAVSSDYDRDSLHVLPLCIVPLETHALQRTRMIKNAQLESVIEMFEGKSTGSGQIKIESLGVAFDSPCPECSRKSEGSLSPKKTAKNASLTAAR